METLKNTSLKTAFIICVLLFTSCNEAKKEDAVEIEQETPMLEVASQEYADLTQKTLDLLSEFDLETWKDYLADDIIWYWPDGNSETNNTFLPLKVNTPSNYYKLVGTGVLAYTDLTISIQDKSTSVRQHMVFMFDKDKKINHALLYYDRTGIIELTNVVLGETE